jgi:large subunit ribosomal protein L27
MAHKKAGGSTSNGRDSNAKRRGVKKFGGESVIPGNILIRQKGNKFWAGEHVGQGNDFTLFALKAGKVQFSEKRKLRFDGRVYRNTYITIV